MKKCFLFFWLVAVILLLQSCATYYNKNRKFNDFFQHGDIEKADEVLAKDKKGAKRNTKLLYFLNRGVTASMLGRYEESNRHFDTALVISESIKKNYALEAASFISNPNILPYRGEDFELLMVHYYKAVNYLYLRKYDAALVECRQMNLKLQTLSDKYKSDNRYKKDAFIHNLMGIIYEADGDYNNAFIAYRNALEIYENDYSKLYEMGVPEQLKHDIIRSAMYTGFFNEAEFYEKKFGIKYEEQPKENGQLVFFWLNGLGPVKDEWSINFFIQRGTGNNVMFVNDEYGFAFPFYYEPSGNKNQDPFSGMEFIRVVLPRYLERPELYTHGELSADGKTYKLEKAESISQIAYQSLEDRMLRELGQSLLRLALKKSAEYATRSQNQGAGAAVGIINAISEQADTRNWQTLPHSIYYTRAFLEPGEKTVTLKMNSGSGQVSSQTFKYNIKSGQTEFHSFHTMAASPGLLPYPVSLKNASKVK